MNKDLYLNKIDSYKTVMEFNEILKDEITKCNISKDEIEKIGINGPYIYLKHEGEKYGKWIHFFDYLIQEHEYEMNVSMWEFCGSNIEKFKYWNKFKADFVGQVADEYTDDYTKYEDEIEEEIRIRELLDDGSLSPMEYVMDEFDEHPEVVWNYNDELYNKMFNDLIEKYKYDYTLEHFNDFLVYMDNMKYKYWEFKKSYKYWEDK